MRTWAPPRDGRVGGGGPGGRTGGLVLGMGMDAGGGGRNMAQRQNSLAAMLAGSMGE